MQADAATIKALSAQATSSFAQLRDDEASFSELAARGSPDFLEDLVQGVKFSCVKHHCSKKMAACDHAHVQCSKRLRCAESAKGRGQRLDCFEGMKVSALTKHEAALLDCTQEQGCLS